MEILFINLEQHPTTQHHYSNLNSTKFRSKNRFIAKACTWEPKISEATAANCPDANVYGTSPLKIPIVGWFRGNFLKPKMVPFQAKRNSFIFQFFFHFEAPQKVMENFRWLSGFQSSGWFLGERCWEKGGVFAWVEPSSRWFSLLRGHPVFNFDWEWTTGPLDLSKSSRRMATFVFFLRVFFGLLGHLRSFFFGWPFFDSLKQSWYRHKPGFLWDHAYLIRKGLKEGLKH